MIFVLVDCKWSNWRNWPTSFEQAGSGVHAWYRFISQTADGGGEECSGESIKFNSTNKDYKSGK